MSRRLLDGLIILLAVVAVAAMLVPRAARCLRQGTCLPRHEAPDPHRHL